MRNFIGFVLIFAGVVFGVYAGLWWAFIGGIVQVIDAAKATPVEAIDIAIGIARVLCAGLIGVTSGFVAVLPGLALIKAGR